jgi:hypothetical protein
MIPFHCRPVVEWKRNERKRKKKYYTILEQKNSHYPMSAIVISVMNQKWQRAAHLNLEAHKKKIEGLLCRGQQEISICGMNEATDK